MQKMVSGSMKEKLIVSPASHTEQSWHDYNGHNITFKNIERLDVTIMSKKTKSHKTKKSFFVF